MNKHVVLLASLAVGLVLLSALIVFAQSGGLLNNGDFELGHSYWNETEYIHERFFAAREWTTYCHEGDWCGAARLCTYYTQILLAQEVTGLVPSSYYYVSLWARDQSQGGGVGCGEGPCSGSSMDPLELWLCMDEGGCIGGGGSGEWDIYELDAPLDEWAEFGPFTAIATVSGTTWVYFRVPGDNCAHYLIDDVVLTGTVPITPTTTTCIFDNHHFDDGNEGWEEIGSPEFVSSTVRLDLNEGISQTLSLEPGTYRVTARARSEGGGLAPHLLIKVEVGGEHVEGAWLTWPSWDDIEMDIEIMPGEEGDYSFSFSSIMGDEDTTLVLDQVCLSGEDWDAIDHPLCFADSQDVLQDFADTGIGIDYAAPLGAGVFAAGAGQVITVAETVSGSLYIQQEVVGEGTGDTYLITYENVNDVQILPGELVVTGQVIGYVGENPAGEDDPYLHFAVYDPFLESYIDPDLLFSDTYPKCLTSGLQDCVLVNADFDHPVSLGWVYGGDWVYLNEANTYVDDGGNFGAFLPVATSGSIFQQVWLPEMPESGYYNLIFDAIAYNDTPATIQVHVGNGVLSTTVAISLTTQTQWDDVFVDISDFAGSPILVQFTAMDGPGDVLIDNTCIIFSTEAEGNPIDFDCDFPTSPEGWDPGPWLQWLGAVIEWLWCMLRSWLHKLWLAILSLPETIKEFLTRFWTETIKPALEWLFDSLGLGWLWDWLEFTAWPWLTDPEYGGLATWIALIIDLLGQFINDPLGTLDALLSALINAVLGFIFSIPAVQIGYDVILAFAYLIWLLRELIASVVNILWQAIVFVVTLAGAAIYALQHPDEIGDIDISPLAVGIQLAQDAIAMTPLIYLEALMVGLLAWSFIMWVLRQFGAQT